MEIEKVDILLFNALTTREINVTSLTSMFKGDNDTYVCIYVFVYIFIYLYVHIYLYMYINIYVYNLHVNTYIDWGRVSEWEWLYFKLGIFSLCRRKPGPCLA